MNLHRLDLFSLSLFGLMVRSGSVSRGAELAVAVRDIVKERCLLAGIEGEFSAHSLRSGFVTEAGRQNMPLAETMAMIGHQSIASVVGVDCRRKLTLGINWPAGYFSRSNR